MKKLLLASLLVIGTGVAQADQGGPDWVATANGAYVSMPPISVTDGMVSRVSWSPDGDNLLVVERPNVVTQEQLLLGGLASVPGPMHIMGWNRSLQRVRALWTAEDPSTTVEGLSWLPGTSAVYITFRWVVQNNPKEPQQPRYGVLWLDTVNGNFKWVPGMEQLVSRPKVVASPLTSQAVALFSDNPADDTSGGFISSVNNDVTVSGLLLQAIEKSITLQGQSSDGSPIRISFGNQEPKANNFWTLAGDGSVRHSIKIEKSLELPLVWNKDGAAWFLRTNDPKTQKPGLFRLTDRGDLQATDEVEFVSTPRTTALTLDEKAVNVEVGKSKVVFNSLWLKSVSQSDHSEFNLSANGSWPELSPTDGAVFYVDAGVGKVRTLISVSKAQLQKLRDAAKQAPQLGLTGNDIRFSNLQFVFTTGGAARAKNVPN